MKYLTKNYRGGGKIIIRFYLTEGKRDAIMIRVKKIHDTE